MPGTRTSSAADDFYRPRRAGESIVLGVLVTLLVHVVGLWAFPWRFVTDQEEWSREIDLSRVEVVVQKAEKRPEEEQQFVESNPAAPANAPDETANFSDRNQQAAQPEQADRLEGRTPQVDGNQEVGNAVSENIAESEPAPQLPPARPQEPQPPQPQPEMAATPPPAPPQPPDFQQVEELTEGEGLQSALREPGEGEKEDERYGEAREVPLNLVDSPEREPSDSELRAREAPPPSVQAREEAPRPRPQLIPQSVSGVVRTSVSGVGQVGPLAYDARATAFGGYLARLNEVIAQRWRTLAASIAAIGSERSTRVVVRFTLHSDGSISDLEIAESNAQNRIAAVICLDAIQSRAPFFLWSEELKAEMGDETELVYGFLYY